MQKSIGYSHYKKNVSIMVLGRVVAQVVPILLTPLIARIYSPEEFGVFGVYSTIVAIVSMVSSGRYCLTVILPKKRKTAEQLLMLASLITIIVTLTFFLLMVLSGGGLFKILNVEELNTYSLLMILDILFLGLYEPLYSFGLRQKKYKILSFNIIMQSLTVLVSRLLFGYFINTGYGLLVSHLLGHSISYILLFFKLKVHRINFGEKLVKLRVLAKKYIAFPRYSLPADILSMGANLSPNLFLNGLFGTVPTGYYSMSDKILGAPLWLITSAIGDVFKQEAAQSFREEGNCYKVFVKTAKTLFFLGIIPFILIFLFVPFLIPILLGQDWTPVGDFIRILSIMYFAKFVVHPVSYVVYIIKKQRLNILFQSMRFLSLVGALLFGYYKNNLYSALISWSVLTTISYILIFKISLEVTKNLQCVRFTQ